MKKEIVASLVRSAVETGLTVTGHPISAKVAGRVLSGFTKAAADRLGEASRQKVENWLGEIAASNEYASAEATIGIITERIDEPCVHGPLEDAVRAIRDGIDEAALVYLAKLAAWQIRDKVPPDRWSRRAARLLLDCDSAMIAALLHFSENLSKRWPPEVDDWVRIARGGPFSGAFGAVQITPLHGRPRDPVVGEHAWQAQPLDPELFSLLRAHQFAAEEGGPHAHEGKMLIHRSEAVYLVRLFLGSAAAAKIPGGTNATAPTPGP